MKITVTEIEASAEDLMANRSLADVLMSALSRICDTIACPMTEAEEDSMIKEKTEDGKQNE